ncbi:MAG: P-II family nitrogen regulator [Acidobacteria bacterium]|nr:P-II family nitrogen regulator [Acidobacteriota bacterium]
MKEIKAIIQEFMLPKVVEALRAHPEFPGLTVSRVKGFGRYGTEAELSETSPKIKLEIVVPAALVDNVVELIRSHAHTGRPGDGKIFVSSIDEVIRIRTGERDQDAL